MFKDTKSMCPICGVICVGEEERHRHIEEKHDGVAGKDEELLEKTSNKELLTE